MASGAKRVREIPVGALALVWCAGGGLRVAHTSRCAAQRQGAGARGAAKIQAKTRSRDDFQGRQKLTWLTTWQNEHAGHKHGKQIVMAVPSVRLYFATASMRILMLAQ